MVNKKIYKDNNRVKSMLETKVINKKRKTVWPLAVLIIAVLLFGGWQIYLMQHGAVDANDTTYQSVAIPPQSSASQIAEILLDKDLIHSEKIFLSYCRSTQLDNKLKAGNFMLSRSQTLEEIVKVIVEGKESHLTFTIPEGYTLKEMGQLLEKQGLVASQGEWMKAISIPYEYSFLNDIPQDRPNRLEGFLFPDTYNITETTNAEDIVSMMLGQFARLWEEEYAALAENQELSALEVVTIASLIEREAAVPEERETISGVIDNRLRINMPLQIDATVLYSLKEHKEIVTNADLKIDSPYNTYKHVGLPPGPIAAPGKDSIKAALNPEKHSYFYYVSRGDGTHEFTKNFNEHLQAISKYNN